MFRDNAFEYQLFRGKTSSLSYHLCRITYSVSSNFYSNCYEEQRIEKPLLITFFFWKECISILEAKVICFWQYFHINRWEMEKRNISPHTRPLAITSSSFFCTQHKNTIMVFMFHPCHIIKLSRNYFFPHKSLFFFCVFTQEVEDKN